jgi:hypothetical protein
LKTANHPHPAENWRCLTGCGAPIHFFLLPAEQNDCTAWSLKLKNQHLVLA